MKRIIIHWTAGVYTPNQHEKECYHFLIDNTGKIHNGVHTPQDNENCSDGKYAAHTGGGNTGSIGVALCGMAGFQNAKNTGRYPITRPQIEACFKLCADLCKKYNIALTPDTVLTHYEFGKKHPATASAGKIDIICLPPFPEVSASGVGNFIRQKIKWYLNK